MTGASRAARAPACRVTSPGAGLPGRPAGGDGWRVPSDLGGVCLPASLGCSAPGVWVGGDQPPCCGERRPGAEASGPQPVRPQGTRPEGQLHQRPWAGTVRLIQTFLSSDRDQVASSEGGAGRAAERPLACSVQSIPVQHGCLAQLPASADVLAGGAAELRESAGEWGPAAAPG